MRLESVYSGIILFCAMILVVMAFKGEISYVALVCALAACITTFAEAPK